MKFYANVCQFVPKFSKKVSQLLEEALLSFELMFASLYARFIQVSQ